MEQPTDRTLSRFPKARAHELVVLWAYFSLQLTGALLGAFLLFAQPFLGRALVSVTDLCLFVGGYLATLAGISLASHRQFSHPAYKTYPPIKFVFYALAAMAFQGKMRNWGTDHRHHHRNADVACTATPVEQTCDVHTPRDGFWHALVGWEIRTFNRPIDERWEEAGQKLALARARGNPKAIANLQEIADNNRLAVLFDRTALLWLTFGLLLPAVIGGFLRGESWSWYGAGLGLLWGGLIRLFAVNLSTSLINSYCHKPGWLGNYRHNPRAKEDSQNNLLLGVVTLNPEVLHANHHQVPNSANHAIYWWEYLVDWSAWIIFVLWKLRLAWDVRWTTPAMFEATIQKSTQGRP